MERVSNASGNFARNLRGGVAAVVSPKARDLGGEGDEHTKGTP
jgi:hypothetical protein